MSNKRVVVKSRANTARKVASASGRSELTGSAVKAKGADYVGPYYTPKLAKYVEAHRANKVKATTLRLNPTLQRGLELLQGVLKQPLNKMVNEAVGEYIQKRTAEVEVDIGALLKQVQAYREKDPDFKYSAQQFVEAEMSVVGNDPAEGVRVTSESPLLKRRRSHA